MHTSSIPWDIERLFPTKPIRDKQLNKKKKNCKQLKCYVDVSALWTKTRKAKMTFLLKNEMLFKMKSRFMSLFTEKWQCQYVFLQTIIRNNFNAGIKMKTRKKQVRIGIASPVSIRGLQDEQPLPCSSVVDHTSVSARLTWNSVEIYFPSIFHELLR